MTLAEIKKRARRLGIKVGKNATKKDLIRSIQRIEGNFECFGTATGYCDQFSCCWRKLCLKK
ncbi:MAG: SAP domain-containing protein [Candidatus Omnitrophota bacterium]|nr:MAG: SAP domain-containing protein [Candidatus Omnitrophota bacterium]